MYDNETGAMQALRDIHTAQTQCSSKIGRYAASLKELEQLGTIDSALVTGIKKGYRYQLAKTENGYTINASPNSFNGTGTRSFFSDQTRLIDSHYGPEMATADDPVVN
jgi:hypothetical protein